jgi:hypothetical protein
MQDARLAFTTERYLGTNIFAYLDAQEYPEKSCSLDGVAVKEHPCHLPLSFLRSMQSGLSKTITSRPLKEYAAVINKKGITAAEAEIKDRRSVGDAEQNRYVAHVFNKFLMGNIAFLEKFDESEIITRMQSFSLTEFEKRMQELYSAHKHRLLSSRPIVPTGFDDFINSISSDAKHKKIEYEDLNSAINTLVSTVCKHKVEDEVFNRIAQEKFDATIGTLISAIKTLRMSLQ